MVKIVTAVALGLAIGLGLPCPQADSGEKTSLADRLRPLVKAHKGKVGLAVKHLDSGESWSYRGNEVMPTASLIKFPVMIEVYQQVLEGKIKLSEMMTLRKADMVPGSGVLTYHFSEGARFSVRDAVRLMIAFSDNTATNMVLDKIGIASTNERMQAWGFPNTRIYAKVFLGKTTSIDPERTERYGLGSTTAKEMVRLFEKVHRGKAVSKKACQNMIEHLKAAVDRDHFPRFLPKGVAAHKTGGTNTVRTDGGILYFAGGPVALVVLTEDNADKRWVRDNAAQLLCARVAQEVYRHYVTKKD